LILSRAKRGNPLTTYLHKGKNVQKILLFCSKGFVAIGISRYARDFRAGAADLGVDLEEHIAFCIEAMKGIAAELGLAGNS
jgi:predicted hydrolase (HD superfamily)